jgi:DNA-binding LytR/AlgR family response regulator
MTERTLSILRAETTPREPAFGRESAQFPEPLHPESNALSRRAEDGVGREYYASRFVIRTGHRAFMIRVRDVDWIASSGNYVAVHAQGKEHRMRATIASLVEVLDPRNFCRIHRRFIVNLDRIREIQPWFSGDYVVILHDGRQLRASRSYARNLLIPIR